MKGVVIKSTGSWYHVRTAEHTIYLCRIRGKFRMEGIKSTNPVSVGDVVEFDLEPKKETGVITKIADRKNYIVRKSVNLSKQIHIIAANIDLAFLMVTIDNPPTTTSFIDRFLIAAEAYHIPVIILFNKVDTFNEEIEEAHEELKEIYESIGYECIDISAKEGFNIDLVKEQMKDRVSLFSGHSGVGKSTLVNTIEPTLNLKTLEISDQHKQGQHTTTFAEMHPLSFGGYIIDTPGIKGFGMVDFEKEEIAGLFPEFFELKQDCKFHNCMHIDEPKCAIKAGLENDTIAPSRYFSYVQIIKGDEEHFRQDIYGRKS
ncbi:ribosome small subunit-dependent GTPase A [Flavicella sediminum]|uniref:ribosome small subunit-dependent GTPase A n=1 Tax=Flavicella sediminum TaxID=2585141 RepID=UPI0011230D8A|nr:ribosome small subunit-dependent GTPase A [Flavicella sediminum]